jgi:hypothetical protein
LTLSGSDLVLLYSLIWDGKLSKQWNYRKIKSTNTN